MVKKRKNKMLKWLLALIPIIALFFFIVSIWASVYSFVYQHILLVMSISVGILFISVLLGMASWKKIKRKIVDIFT